MCSLCKAAGADVVRQNAELDAQNREEVSRLYAAMLEAGASGESALAELYAKMLAQEESAALSSSSRQRASSGKNSAGSSGGKSASGGTSSTGYSSEELSRIGDSLSEIGEISDRSAALRYVTEKADTREKRLQLIARMQKVGAVSDALAAWLRLRIERGDARTYSTGEQLRQLAQATGSVPLRSPYQRQAEQLRAAGVNLR